MTTNPTALEAHIRSLSDTQRARLARDSKTALRTAWAHRHSSFRAPMVVRANVQMLRNLA
jgi:hypothetical protein